VFFGKVSVAWLVATVEVLVQGEGPRFQDFPNFKLVMSVLRYLKMFRVIS
jgi:hypothetical protein